MFFVAEAGAATPGKDGGHKATDFLIELPTRQRRGDYAPFRRALRLLPFDEGFDEWREQRQKRAKRQPRGSSFRPHRAQTQIMDFKS